MKSILKLSFALLLPLFLAACSAAPQTQPAGAIPQPTDAPVDTAAEADAPILKSSIGDFAVISTRLVNEAHGTAAPEGFQYLLVGLANADQSKLVAGEFSFENFQAMTAENTGKIYVMGSDGSKADYGTMGGWLDSDEGVADDFVLGFLVTPADSYTLYWPDTPAIPLQIAK